MSTKAEVVEQVLLANPGATAAKIAELVKAAGFDVSLSSIAQVKGKLVTAGKLQKGTRGRKPKNADPNAAKAEMTPRAKKAAVVHAPSPVENSQPVTISCCEKVCAVTAPESIDVIKTRHAVECLEFVAKTAKEVGVSIANADACKRCISEALAILGL